MARRSKKNVPSNILYRRAFEQVKQSKEIDDKLAAETNSEQTDNAQRKNHVVDGASSKAFNATRQGVDQRTDSRKEKQLDKRYSLNLDKTKADYQ